MARLSSSSQIVNIINDQDKFRYIQLFLQDVQSQLNGGIDIEQNLRVIRQEVNFTVANSNTRVVHSFGRPLLGYIVVSLSTPMIVYDGSPFFVDNNTANLRTTAVGRATVLLY